MSYYHSLASALRAEKLPEGRVRDVLEEVRETAALSGRSPEEEFGTPQSYAERFEKGTTRSLGVRFTLIAGVVAGFALVVNLILGAMGRPIASETWQAAMMVFAILVAGVVVGFLVDLRLPRGFTLDASAAREDRA